ncbi:MAG: hypothetical protein J07HB67_00107, partial [halophilic archaeon J07HB67]
MSDIDDIRRQKRDQLRQRVRAEGRDEPPSDPIDVAGS